MKDILSLAMMELAPGLCWTGTIKTKQDFETKCYRIVDSKLSESPSDFGCTWEELEAKMASLQEERDAQAYARNRKEEYPDLAEQLDLLWHAIDSGTLDNKDHRNKFYSTLKTVKTNNPKG